MANHTTFGIKKEHGELSPNSAITSCAYRYPQVDDSSHLKEDFDLDMDLSKFLGEPTLPNASNEYLPSEWDSLFSGTELEGLDPTTGAPSTNNIGGVMEHSGFNPGMMTLSSPVPSFPSPQVEMPPSQQQLQHQGSPPSNGAGNDWLFEQSQKLERQQQLQQQKLLELEQTLLRTEILKNRLEIVSNLKHATPEVQTQLIGILSNRPGPVNSVQSPPPQLTLGNLQSTPAQITLATPTTVNPRLVSRANVVHVTLPCTTTNNSQVILHQSLPSPPDSEQEDQMVGGVKKKSHNLIEKKYRTSINDRIGVLRDMVARHFKDDRKMQKSAVLQKTIDYIHYLENCNRKLTEENKQLKTLLNGHQNACVGVKPSLNSSNGSTSPINSWGDYSEGHPSSPDVFLSDTSPGSSPPLAQSPLPSTSSYLAASHGSFKAAGQIFMCFMLVMCFYIDPLAFVGGGGTYPSNEGTTHGRTLSSVEGVEMDGMFTLGWILVWLSRLLFGGACFGWMWVSSLPKYNPDNEGVQFWRLNKQAEKEIKKGQYVSAKVHLVESLTVIGLSIPSSYTSMCFSLFWNGFSHVLFQLYIGQFMVNFMSFVTRTNIKRSSSGTPSVISYADIAKTKHLLHKLNLASYDSSHMHGLGFYLGLSALNYAEIERSCFSHDQWAELLFSLGVQCQFSCACMASLLARYYFLCAGNIGGLLPFVDSEDGWDFLLSKEWVAQAQMATKVYKGVAAYPKYSITRSYCRTLLSEAYKDLVLPNNDVNSLTINECQKIFEFVLSLARKTNSHLLNDTKMFTGGAPSLSDAMASRDSGGFDIIMWWASVGIVACQWSLGKDVGIDEHYPIIENLPKESGPIPSALHLAFKAQRLNRQSPSPPSLHVMSQLCAAASHALKICDRNMSTETHLSLFGLLLACDWLLNVRYCLCDNSNEKRTSEGDKIIKQLVEGYKQDVGVLSQLVSHLPGAFPQLSKHRGYQRIISGGNPVLADSFLSIGGEGDSLLSCRNRKTPLEAQ